MACVPYADLGRVFDVHVWCVKIMLLIVYQQALKDVVVILVITLKSFLSSLIYHIVDLSDLLMYLILFHFNLRIFHVGGAWSAQLIMNDIIQILYSVDCAITVAFVLRI